MSYSSTWKKLTLAVFVYVATVNAYKVFKEPWEQGVKVMDCYKFMLQLAKELVKPWAEEQLLFHGKQGTNQPAIKTVFSHLNISRQLSGQSPGKKNALDLS